VNSFQALSGQVCILFGQFQQASLNMMWVAIDCGPHVRRVHGQLEAWMLLGLRCKFEAFSEDSQELVETS
jgi:hypothetical protein